MKTKIVWLVLLFFLVSCGQNQNEKSRFSSTNSLSVAENSAQELLFTQLKQAQSENSDVKAWLQVPGTEINGPVLQGKNNEYYLRRDLNRQKSIWGSYFFDYKTTLNKGIEDKVTVIFGHSLGDSSEEEHFSQLKKYSEAKFAIQNPSFTIVVGDSVYVAEVFAAGLVSAYTNYLLPEPNQTEFESNLKALRLASTQPFSTVDVSYGDKIVILSTCAPGTDIRYVVGARLQEQL